MADKPEDAKKKRAASIMGDEARASQPRVSHATPQAWPVEIHDEITPPPIIIDEIGKPLSSARSRRESQWPDTVSRDRKTIQEYAEELWPARKALQLVMDQMERIVKLETRVEDITANGPAELAAQRVDGLRAELVGADGEGGIIRHLADNVARDLIDHRRITSSVEERALRADKFVRRVIYAAAGAIGGSIIAAVLLIYSAGERAATSRADTAAARLDVQRQMEAMSAGLTDLRGQVKLLIEDRIKKP